MEDFINPQEFLDALAYGLQAYVVMLIVGSIGGMYLWRYLQSRKGTFVILVAGLFSTFILCFYGLPFLMTNIWNWGEWMSVQAMYGLGLLIALILILLPIIPLRIMLNETKSPLQMEYENLSEEEMSPIDVRRREYMERRKSRNMPKPPHQI